MDMLSVIEKYTGLGYVQIPTDSGTGSTILVNNNLARVIKINQDTAYNEFIDYISGKSNLLVPVVYGYEKIGEAPYEGTHGFSVVTLEQLSHLTKEEGCLFESWMRNYWECKRNNNTPTDDYGLLKTIEVLVENAKVKSVNIDLNKSTNIMKRCNGEYVVIDPYS